MPDAPGGLGALGFGLTVRLALARLVLAWERLWPAAWPMVGVAGLFLAVALFDLLPALPGWLHLVLLAAFAGAFLWAAARGIAAFRAPDANDARRRIERSSALKHRPLTVVRDRLAAGADDPHAVALWLLHKRRMEESIRRLRVGIPAPGLARRDPAAFRGALLVVLVVAAVAAWPDPGPRIARAVVPQLGDRALATATLRLWITPPDYTGRPPLFPAIGTSAMAARDGAAAQAPPAEPPLLTVPTGSVLTAQVNGGVGQPRLLIGPDSAVFERVADSAYKAGATITRGGRLTVQQGGKVLGDWRLAVVPDQPPTVELAAPPEPTERSALKLAYRAGDDYGLAKLDGRIRLKAEDGSEAMDSAIELSLPLPRLLAKEVEEATYHDLTTHPWAGLEAFVRLTATDGAGQTGETPAIPFVIPERQFNHPVARAIIEQRKQLSRGPEVRPGVAEALERIAARPDLYDHDVVVFLALVMARSRLRYDHGGAAVTPVQKLLWDTALRLEDGKLSIVERELRELQQRLMEALARDATDAELEQLMRELEEALQRYLQALAEEMRRRSQDDQAQQQLPFDPQSRFLEGQDLMRMLQRARELMQMGARDAARDMLAQLRNILENMQAGRMMSMRQMMQNNPGGQALRQLQEMIRRQNELLDRSFRMSREGQPQQGQMQSGAADQQALREALQQLREMLSQMGADPGEAFGRADRAMGEAADQLGQGQPGNAIGPQTEALDQLQQAGRDLMQQMMQQMGFGPGPGFGDPRERLQGRRDPLGRPLPEENRGYDAGDVKIPDESDIQRAKRIVDELRRRAGQRSREQYELDYIDRLLRRF
jgi:uncharacterized protein (TIGR02302 family)